MKKINNTFQHKFSILHGSIVNSLLKTVHLLGIQSDMDPFKPLFFKQMTEIEWSVE